MVKKWSNEKEEKKVYKNNFGKFTQLLNIQLLTLFNTRGDFFLFKGIFGKYS